MYQCRSDITLFCFTIFSKWLYTEMHAPSIFLFLIWQLNPMEDFPWSEQTLVSLSLAVTLNVDMLDFCGCNTNFGKFRKEKKANSSPSVKKTSWKEVTFMYVHMVVDFIFLSANYEMFHLIYHISPYLLILIVCYVSWKRKKTKQDKTRLKIPQNLAREKRYTFSKSIYIFK